ncbi:hypothetical protein Hanom_Chr15g01400271 [Helianthus anomalus]
MAPPPAVAVDPHGGGSEHLLRRRSDDIQNRVVVSLSTQARWSIGSDLCSVLSWFGLRLVRVNTRASG